MSRTVTVCTMSPLEVGRIYEARDVPRGGSLNPSILEQVERGQRDHAQRKRREMQSLCRSVWAAMQRGESTGWLTIEDALREKGLKRVLEECR